MLILYEYIKAFDIYITDNTGTEVTVNDGEYKISIPISTTYDMYKVAHVKNGKIVGTLDTIYNNGYIQFTTPNFSDFVIYGKNNVVTPPVSHQVQFQMLIQVQSQLAIRVL